MTDTMRERMAAAIAKNAEDQAQAYGALTPYADVTDLKDGALLDGYFNLYQFVDAVLAVLETPSEAVIQAGENDGWHSIYRWAAMVKAIRGGA